MAFGNRKANAKKSGIPFEITFDDLEWPDVCPLLDIKIHYDKFDGKKGPRDNSPSIDRIDPDFGYVRGNVWVICNRANRIKSDAQWYELLLVGNRLKKKMVKNG
jgi:hypothetical protein